MLSASGSTVTASCSPSAVPDRDNVIPRAVVPDRVAHLERATGVAELLRAVWETDDQRWHGGRTLSPGGFKCEKPSDAGADRHWQRELAGDEQTDVVLLDLADDPQLTPVTHEVADLGDGADVVDLPRSGEVERDARLGVTHGGECPDSRAAKRRFCALRLRPSVQASAEGAPRQDGLMPERGRCAPLRESRRAFATRRRTPTNGGS